MEKQTRAGATAAERVGKFITEWRGFADKGEEVFCLHVGTPQEARLLCSDLDDLLVGLGMFTDEELRLMWMGTETLREANDGDADAELLDAKVTEAVRRRRLAKPLTDDERAADLHAEGCGCMAGAPDPACLSEREVVGRTEP